jgi:hypothetical protein
MVDAESGLTYRFNNPRPNESVSETVDLVKRNRVALMRGFRLAGWGVGTGNNVTNLNPNHLQREVVVDGIHYVQAVWARDWAGRDPSPAETNVLQVLNSRRKRAAAADPNEAERGALKLINIRRLEQDRLRPNFLHQLKQVPDSDTALAAALLSCADDAQTLDEKVAALNYHNAINGGDDHDGECDEDEYARLGLAERQRQRQRSKQQRNSQRKCTKRR